MKPAVQGTVRPLLEKAKQKAITANPSAAMAEPEEEVKAPSATKKTSIKGGTAASKTTKTAVGSRATLGKTAVSKSGEDAGESPAKPKTATLTRKPVGSRPGPTLKAAAVEEEPFSVNPGNKERRAQLDSNSKWVHDDVKPVHLTAVKKQSEEVFGTAVSTLMWSADFKKHVKVLEQIVSLIDAAPQDLMDCVDVIFKWTNVKLNESGNTAF